MPRIRVTPQLSLDAHDDVFDRDPLDDGDRDGDPMEDASRDDFNTWAETYDMFNGGPESEYDR